MSIKVAEETSQNKSRIKKDLVRSIRLTGVSLILIGLIIITFIYLPIISSQIRYLFEAEDLQESQEKLVNDLNEIESDTQSKEKELSKYFPDKDFSIFIPKIGARSVVIEGVDPFDPNEYNIALENGIAQASNGYYPGSGGNTFLFAHSAMDFYKMRDLNVNFYLLDKLEPEDRIFLRYKDRLFVYAVRSSEIVDPSRIDLINNSNEIEQLTLMTCWPAGTDYKRVIVSAVLEKSLMDEENLEE